MNPSSFSAPAACIGIDWADESHAVALRVQGADQIEHFTLDAAPEAVAAWLETIKARFGGQPVVMATEQSRGRLINQLSAPEHAAWLRLYALNPASVARFRSTFFPSGRKDDPGDAALILELVQTHAERLRPRPQGEALTTELRLLCETRRAMIETRVGLCNQLRQALKDTFPQALELLGKELFSTTALGFLRRWPTLAEAQRARPATIRAFYYAMHVRRPDTVEKRLAVLRAALPVTTEGAITGPSRLLITCLVRQIEAVQKSVAACDGQIARLYAAHPDAAIYDSLPGTGPALAPRLAAAMGVDRSLYADAGALQKASGIAPVQESSGKYHRTRRRFARPLFMHQTFFEWAKQSIQTCAWAAAYVQTRQSAGKTFATAVRALAFKWQRILFACWKNRRPYDEAVCLAAFKAKGSPLANACE